MPGRPAAANPVYRGRMPLPFFRWPTTCLHAASTGPEPIRQPFAR